MPSARRIGVRRRPVALPLLVTLMLAAFLSDHAFVPAPLANNLIKSRETTLVGTSATALLFGATVANAEEKAAVVPDPVREALSGGGGTKAATDAALDIAAKKLDGAVPLRDANIPGFEGFGGVEGISSAIKSATDVASTAPQEEFDFNTWWNNWLMTPESDYITIPLLVIVSTFFLTNFLLFIQWD
mmetsp:Transcript_9923/g.19105  ORF Transcript_9923/g.19105 Transcript_9923/m.19105 type:complete len:187 (+) Transcript_9923:68-628(+)